MLEIDFNKMLKSYLTACEANGAKPNSDVLKHLEEDETAFNCDRLSFGVNYLGDRGVRAFIPLLGANDHLKYLNLSMQGIHNPGAEVLCTAFLHHPSLANLDLSQNRICDRGGRALLGLAEANEALLTLSVEGNDFRSAVKDEIDHALDQKQRAPSRFASVHGGNQNAEAPVETDIDDSESIAPPAFTPVASYYSLPVSRRISNSTDANVLSYQVLHGLPNP